MDGRDVGDAGISGSATVVNNTVYVSTYEPGSYGLNAVTGKQVWLLPRRLLHAGDRESNALFLMGKYVLYKFVPKK